MKKAILILFLLVSAGELISTLIHAPGLHMVCKPVLMLVLLAYYWFHQKSLAAEISTVVMLGLIFSGAGDILLMFQGEQFFMFGLISFLLAHVFYIFAYRQHQRADEAHALHGLQKIRFALPIVLAGGGLVSILYGGLGDLRIPVIVYATVITLMTLTALFRFGRTTTPSFAMVFAGAILFMMSDSLLAINKFLEPLALAGFWIMLTYIGAQVLIVLGLIRHRD